MAYIALLIVALIAGIWFYVNSPESFTRIKNYTESIVSSDSAMKKPVSLTRDIARTTDINAIQNALLQYRIEKGAYPDSLSVLAPDYIPTIPHDPKTGDFYDYSAKVQGESYEICVLFESKTHQANPCFGPN